MPKTILTELMTAFSRARRSMPKLWRTPGSGRRAHERPRFSALGLSRPRGADSRRNIHGRDRPRPRLGPAQWRDAKDGRCRRDYSDEQSATQSAFVSDLGCPPQGLSPREELSRQVIALPRGRSEGGFRAALLLFE